MDGSVQDGSITSAFAMEILRSCIKLSNAFWCYASLLPFFIKPICMQCKNAQHNCHVSAHSHMLINDWSMEYRKLSSSSHSVSLHHPIQGVSHRDDWEHRACRNNDHWNKTQIPRRFYMIGSHHPPCPYSPIHMGQVFHDDHLLLRGWWLKTQVEELLMVVWLMGKLCSRTHNVSSHHPTQEVFHLDDWEHRACQNSDHWNKTQIPRRFYMIGSHHPPCPYSPIHMGQVFHDGHLLLRGWWLKTQVEELLMVVWLMGKLCSRNHNVSSHHPTQEVSHRGDWEHRACRNNDHWNRIQIPHMFYMIGSHHRACRCSPTHMGQVLRGWWLTA